MVDRPRAKSLDWVTKIPRRPAFADAKGFPRFMKSTPSTVIVNMACAKNN
jgi:hypothetical protein